MQAIRTTIELETHSQQGWYAEHHFVYRDTNGWHLCYLQPRHGKTIEVPIVDGISFYEIQLLFKRLTGFTITN